ncbi:MAG: ribokinase [Beijerinckiaceae bacterium]
MVLVFGSVNLDLIFDLRALPAPGETVLARGMRTEPGGKGANQAVAAALDGARVALFGAVGRDGFADEALAGLRSAGVDLSGLARVDAPTGVASIATDEAGRNAIAVAPGANLLARQSTIPDAALRGAILLLQMECDVAETAALIERAHDCGARTILNLAPAAQLPDATLRKTSLVVVNESEAEFLARQFGVVPDAASLAKAIGAGIVRTLGEAGCEAFVDGAPLRIEGCRVDAIDTTAAGDCFVGVLAAGLDRRESLERALRRANVAAGLACTKRGSQRSLPRAGAIDAAAPAG